MMYRLIYRNFATCSTAVEPYRAGEKALPLGEAFAHGQASLRTTSQSASQTAPLVGEPLAKRQGFPVCQGLPSIGEVARRRRDGEVSFRCGSRSGSPPYNLSVSLSLDSSPSRGASGEEGSFSDDSRSPKTKTAPSRKIPRWSGDIQEMLSRRC